MADGTARISVDTCDQKVWGVVSWEQNPGGLDSANPDPSRRSRAILGLPIILNMTPSRADRWSGEVYNAKDGKTYTAHITMLAPDQLKLEGCVLGFLCGGETWTRAPREERSTVGAARPPAAGKPSATTGRPAQTAARTPGNSATGKAPVNVCASVADASGRAASGR